MRTIHLLLFLFTAFGVSQTSESRAAAPPVPADWLIGSENETEPETYASGPDEDSEAEASPTLSETMNHLFDAQAVALDGTAVPAKTPWRLAAVMTELSVSASGWLGFLVQKGTPSVTTVWRRQQPVPVAGAASFDADEESEGTSLRPEMTRAEVENALEPAVRALLASGAIRGEANLRHGLQIAAEDFQNSVALLSATTSKGQWWISRFRLDVAVDASGNVSPAVTLGAEAKVRFEWHRLQEKKVEAPAPSPRFAFTSGTGLGESLATFATNLADDLSEIADDEATSVKGFRAYGYRVGLGITKKGNVGVAKASGALTGHLYFSRDVKKPVVRPKPLAAGDSILLVDDAKEDRTRKVERRVFRKGLKKALRIGRFFARRASKNRGKWRIYELRTGFELSYGGKTGIAKVNGLAATEIAFYNQNF